MVFFFQAEDGIRDATVTGVQTCALPISRRLLEYLLDLFETANLARDVRFAGLLRAEIRRLEQIEQILEQTACEVVAPCRVEPLGGKLPRSEERRVGKGGRCRR